MERDFVGYGKKPPAVRWPGDARLAVSLVVNYEEGAEKSVQEGDELPERFGEWSYPMSQKIRDFAVETMYEYGTRVGIWRLMRLFDKYGVKVTFFACAKALEQNVEAAKEIVSKGHEVCSHGYRWEEHCFMTKEAERESIRKAVASFEKTTGQRPYGWFCRYCQSMNTRELLLEKGFLYDSDSFGDDVPYWVKVKGEDFLVVPYSPDANDFHFWWNRFATANSFYEYLKDSFDVLYEEGVTTPRMMSVGLHLRIIGRTGRIGSLERFIRYAKRFPDVWFARRIDIARWWMERGPKPAR